LGVAPWEIGEWPSELEELWLLFFYLANEIQEIGCMNK
jgi:hypothetical protein